MVCRLCGCGGIVCVRVRVTVWLLRGCLLYWVFAAVEVLMYGVAVFVAGSGAGAVFFFVVVFGVSVWEV